MDSQALRALQVLVIVFVPRLVLAQGAPIVVAPPPAPVKPPAVGVEGAGQRRLHVHRRELAVDERDTQP